MDINKTRAEVQKQREQLTARLEQIAQERNRLKDEESQITRQLTGLDQVVDGLDFMDGVGIPDLEPLGFTDRIRRILNETNAPLLPTQIRDLLAAQGQTGSSAKNFLISIHTVLTRIDVELDKVKVEGGKIAYINKNRKIAIGASTKQYLMNAMSRAARSSVPPPPKIDDVK
jgi:hypothetical protein